MNLQQLREVVARKAQTLDAIFKSVGSDVSKLTAEQVTEVNTLATELKTDKARLAELVNLESVATGAGQDVNSMIHPTDQPSADNKGLLADRIIKSLGDQLVGNDTYQAWFKSAAGNSGIISESKKGFSSPPVGIMGLLKMAVRPGVPVFKTAPTQEPGLLSGTSGWASGAGSTSAGSFVAPDFTGIYVPIGYRPLVFRDIITVGSTTSDTVEYVRQTAFTIGATVVGEAITSNTNADDDVSGQKPKSSLTFVRVMETVKTIAHWVPATKRALSDAGQLLTMVNNFLLDGLALVLEDQMVNGDGIGDNFTGFTRVAGLGQQAFDTDVLVSLRKGKTVVRIGGRAIPTAYVLNCYDWEAIQLMKDSVQRFYGAGPFAPAGVPTLWGLPVVESEIIVQDTGWVGDWKTCVLWDREQGSVSVSDQHADFFTRNLVAILAECRAAFGVLKPKAIVKVALTA